MKPNKRNKDIQRLIKQNGLNQYDVAEALGVTSGYFYGIMHRTLSEERRGQIIAAITKAKEALSNEK